MLIKSLKIIGLILLAFILLILGYVLFMIATDYRPKPQVPLQVEDNKDCKLESNKDLSLTTFNIGYCGMDKDVDFFMDGGVMSRSISKEKTLENLQQNEKTIANLNSDFVFLQEIDKKATRSYKVNEYNYLKDKLNDKYSFTFAINYKVPWVPIPLTHPHGQVLAGITTLSKYYIDSSIRYDLPGKEFWLRQLGDLDRCMMVDRIPVDTGKDLVLINAHLSAYDKGGKIRREQLGFITNFLKTEYRKGNYVIIGGDWNQQMPGTDAFKFPTTEERPDWLQDIPSDAVPAGFKWAVDANTPSCRTVATPYVKGKNLTAIIDGFLVSDNVDITSVEGSNLDFVNSDHNPVTMRFRLK